MRRHSDAVLAALTGFVLTGAIMVPPVLTAYAEKAVRIAAYDKVLGPDTTRFGNDRAGRLASVLRNGDYRDEAQQQIADARGSLLQATR